MKEMVPYEESVPLEAAAEVEAIEADPELLIKKNVVGAIKTLVEIMDGSFNDRLRIEAAKSLIQLARSMTKEDVVEIEEINVTEIQEQILEILRRKNERRD